MKIEKMNTPKQRVLVTGAAGGMGQALVRLLVQQGTTVIGLDHNSARLTTLADELQDGGFVPLNLDLADDQLPRVLEATLAQNGGLTGVVNLAGISCGDSIDQLEDSDWNTSLEVNVTAPMRISRIAIRFMPENAGGSIVNVGSPVGMIGARKPSYAASKGALHGLTMSLARNLGPRGIRANLLLPGTCLTPMTRDWSKEKVAQVSQGSFLKRLCRPEEVAAVIVFLLSPSASYITGSVIDMTAGGLWGH